MIKWPHNYVFDNSIVYYHLNSMDRNRASEIIVSLNIENGLDCDIDKENGLYSIALNRRNSSRIDDNRVPFGETQIKESSETQKAPKPKKRAS